MRQKLAKILRHVVHARRPYSGDLSMVSIIFTGTLVMTTCLIVLVLYSHFFLGHRHELGIFLVSVAGMAYLLGVGLLIRFQRQTIAAWMIIIFFGIIACYTIIMWSVNVPAGILMLAFTIILAGVMLGARFIIPVTIGVTVILVVVQVLTMLNIIDPDTSHLANEPNFGDVAGYGTIFIVFAVVMWLSRLRLEQSLQHTLNAEQALEVEKQSLAIRLEEKTRHLREAQLEEMRQLYRFSELGQSSTALLHELANDLAVITLDMDEIDHRQEYSGNIKHAKQSIAQLDRKIRELRLHLKESAAPQRFAVNALLKDVVRYLKHKSDAVHVDLRVQGLGLALYTRGDPQKLSQALTVLVTNAIEASVDGLKPKLVDIEVSHKTGTIHIIVTDYGRGISASQRKVLFKPFTSTKKSGMGIGLFIAKQIIEIHMHGTIHLDPRRDQTTFVVTLPEDH